MYKTLPQHTNNKLLDLTDIPTNLFEDFKFAGETDDDITVVAMIRIKEEEKKFIKKNDTIHDKHLF